MTSAIALLAVDLGSVVLRIPYAESWDSVAPPEAIAQVVEAGRLKDVRLSHDDAGGPRPLNNGARWGYRNARGYSQLVPAKYSQVLDLRSPRRVRFTGAPFHEFFVAPAVVKIIGCHSGKSCIRRDDIPQLIAKKQT